MKKIICLLLFVFFLCGCSINDEKPTKSVEQYLSNYKSLKTSVISELKTMVNNMDYIEEHKDKYLEIMKRQYSNLDYKIENVNITGKEASVDVKINVFDYFKVNKDVTNYKNYNMNEFMENGKFNKEKYDLFLLNSLKETNDKMDYSLEFKLTKEGNSWVIKNIDKTMKEKMQGIYDYNG